MPNWKKVITSGSDATLNSLNLTSTGNGQTVLDIQGSQGQLFSITDDLTGDIFSISDISGVPIFNINASGATTFDGYVPDNSKLKFGNSGDLEIYHDGSHSRIKDVGTGNLVINASSFVLNNSADSKNMIIATDGGATSLYCNGSLKLATTSTGVAVTGQAAFTGDVQLVTSTGEYSLYGEANGQTALYHNGVKKFETGTTGVTITGNANFSGFVLDGNTITGIDDSGEFTNDDAHIMTSAAVDDRIKSFGYSTNSGTMSSWTIKEGNGTESTTVTNGETVTIEDGTGIQSELTSTSSGGTITITNTAPAGTTHLNSNTTKSDVGLGNVANESRATILSGDFTGTIKGESAADVVSGAAAGATANQDSTSTIRSGTTKANVGLGSVDNKSSATIRGEITSTNVTDALGFTPTSNTGTMSSWTIKEGNGTESTTVTNGETFTIEDGTGIQSELTSTTSGGTITITNTAPAGATHLNSNTTKSDVGLSNVANESRATILGGDLTGKINGVAVADVTAGAAKGATSNQDSTSTIRSGTTKANVGLGNVTNESKATMFSSAALTGNPTAPTQAANNNSTRIATTAYVQKEITDLIGGAPGALDTLNELATAIGDDASYASSITTALSGKLSTTGKAADSEKVDGINGASLLRSDTADTFTGTLTMGTQNALVANNYGRGVYGLYSASRYQHVWSMGTAYNLADNGTTPGDMYGLAFTHTNNTQGQAKSGLSHQLLVMSNGVTKSAIGSGIWTSGIITANGGTSTNWNTAYGWGDHSTEGYAKTKSDVGLGNVANSSVATILSGNLTGKVNGVAVADVTAGAAKGATANQDSTSTIRSGTTKANVGLGSVDNKSSATIRGEITSANVTDALGYTPPTANTNTNQLTTFQVEDGDGTEVTISHGKEWKFLEGQGINVNWTDTNQGIDSDPFDLQFALKANGVRANELNVSGNGTSTQFLRSDGDGSFTWAVPTDTILEASEVREAFTAGANISISDTGEIAATDTNTVYSHPSYNGDDFSVDTGVLTGATVVSDIDINVTTDSLGHVTDANGSVSTRTLTLANLGYTGATNANRITNNNQLTNGAGYITSFTNTVDMGDGFKIANVDGEDQFTVTENEEIRFAGSGATSVSFDSSTQKITISSTDTNTNTTYSAGTGLSLSGTTFSLSGDTFDNEGTYSKLRAQATTAGDVGLGSVENKSSATIRGELTSANVTTALGYTPPTSNTNTTYSADGNYGLTLSGTTFRLENDRRRNSSTQDIHTGNTHDYTFYDASHGIRWYTAGAEEMRLENDGDLHVDGDVIAYSTVVPSDERLKDNVTTIENPLDKIKALRGVEFDWNSGSRKGKPDLGLIAQEVENVLPNIVHEHQLPLLNDDEEDETSYKTVDYEKMVAVLIEGIKEQQNQIDSLKSELTEIKGRL